MAEKKLSAHAFERKCGIANGYLGKQIKSKGAIGSEILEKIHQQFVDLNLSWLLTGEGVMLLALAGNADDKGGGGQLVEEEGASYQILAKSLIASLQKQVTMLEKSNAEKEEAIVSLKTALKKNTEPG
jgi:hypothetical protein